MKARLESVTLKVLPGDHLDDSAQQALELSIEHRVPVVFTHNGRTYRVKYLDLLDQIRPDPLSSSSWGGSVHGN